MGGVFFRLLPLAIAQKRNVDSGPEFLRFSFVFILHDAHSLQSWHMTGNVCSDSARIKK